MTPEQFDSIYNLLTGTTVIIALNMLLLIFIFTILFCKEWDREKNRAKEENDKHIKELIEEARKNERK